MDAAHLSQLPKDELVSKLRSLQMRAANLTEAQKLGVSRALGQMAAVAGGIAGAAAKKYLPDLIPGESIDDPALLGLSLLLDIGAIAMGTGDYANEANFFAAGFGGFIAGSAVEKILP